MKEIEFNSKYIMANVYRRYILNILIESTYTSVFNMWYNTINHTARLSATNFTVFVTDISSTEVLN